jgi:hypothetical protein
MNVAGGDLNWIGTLNDSQFQQSLRRMESGVNRTTSGILSQGNAIESYANKASQAVAAFFSVQAATGFVSSLVDVRSEFQQLDIAFSTMLKSKVAADRLMKELIVFAGTTPFGLKDAAGAAKQLLAYGSTAKGVIGELRMLGDVASGVSIPIGDLVYLYGTLKTQGRAYAMDIRQFAGRGIPIYAELAKVLGVAKDEVAGLVSAGKVGFAEVEQAFKNMTAAGGMFGGLMEAQSKTWKGQIERFKDAWDIMLNDIGKGQESIFSIGIASATSFVENYKQVLDILGLLIYSYGAYRAALIAYTVAEVLATNSVVVHGLAVRQLTTFEAIQAAGKRLLISLQATYNAVLAASPIGATIALLAALGAVIYSLSQYMTAAEATQERFNTIQEESSLSANKEARSVKALVDVIKSQVATNEQRDAAYKKLQETTKGVLIGFSQEEIAAGKATSAINGYIKSIQEAAVARTAFSEFQKLNDQLAELEVKGVGAISMMDKAALRAKGLGSFLNYQLTGVPDANKADFDNAKAVAGFGGDANAAIVATQKKNLQDQLDALTKKYNKQITNELTKTAPGEETFTSTKRRSVDAINEDIKKLKEEQDSLSETSKQYQNYQKQIDALNREKTAITGKQTAANKKEISDRQRFLNDLLKVEDEAFRKGLTKDQEEIKAAQDKADALRVDARKKGLGSGVITRIDNIEIKETGDINYRQSTERLKTQLDEQKQLYDDYEAYILELGKVKADERFKNQIDISKTYAQNLESELGVLLEKDPTKMSGPEQERLIALTERLNKAAVLEQQSYDQAYIAAMTHEQKVALIKEKYVQVAAKLGATLTATQKAELLDQQTEEIKSANQTAFQKTAIYKKLAEQTITYTKEALKAEIKAAENILKDSGLDPALRSQVEKHLNELNDMLGKGINSSNVSALEARKKAIEKALVDPLIAGTEVAKEYQRELLAIQGAIDNTGIGSGKTADMFKGDTAEVAGNVAKGMGDLSGSFGELSSALEGVNDDLAYTLGSIGELLNVGQNAAGAVASFASGDFIGGITKTVSAISGLFGISKKVKEMNEAARKVVSDYYDAAIAGEREYQALLRKRELDDVARGKTSYQSIIAQLELLKRQSPEIAAAYDKIFASLQGQESVEGVGYKHGTWLRKAKTWDIMASLAGSDYENLEKLYTQGKLKDAAKKDFEVLKALREELKAAGISVDELQQQLNEMLTGTSVEGLSDALSDLFENGKTAASDFGNTFENIMRKAIINSFKLNVIQKAMQPVFDSLRILFENGKMPGESEIKTFLDYATKVGVRLSGQFSVVDEMLKKLNLTGVNGSSDQTMPGRITSITMDQADKLSGLFNGFRLAQFEANSLTIANGKVNQMMLDNAISNLAYVIKIEQHAAIIVTNTDRLSKIEQALVSIDKKMDNGANALAGTGRKVI